MVEFPNTGQPFGTRLRRTLVPGFPYGLLSGTRTNLDCRSRTPEPATGLLEIASLDPTLRMRIRLDRIEVFPTLRRNWILHFK